MYKEKLTEYTEDFKVAMDSQLESDFKRWGNTWQERPIEGQEFRIKERFDSYFDQFKHAGHPVPWLKIANLALIAWVRENEEKSN